MFLSSSDQFLHVLQFEQRERIEFARRIRLARQPRRSSFRRSVGRQLIRIGARLAADPALARVRSA